MIRIASFLVSLYAHIYPTSKRGTLERAGELLETHAIEPQHMYRALDILAEESDSIEKAVYQNSLAVVERRTELLYYDCTNFYFGKRRKPKA